MACIDYDDKKGGGWSNRGEGGCCLKIIYRFGENDFLNFQSFLRGWEIISWLIIEMMIVCVGILVGGIIYWISDQLRLSYFLFVIVLLLLNIVLFGSFWLLIVIKLTRARQKGLFGWVHLNFTEKGFHLLRSQSFERSEGDQGYFQAWSGVKRLRESKDYFFLSLGMGKEIIIPKRAFSIQEEIDVFRKYVNKRI